MISAQLLIKTRGDYGRPHNACRRIAARNSGHTGSFSLSRPPQSRGDADIVGERTANAKPRQVAKPPGCSPGCHAGNRSRQFADLVGIRLALNLVVDLIQPAALRLDILASLSHLQPLRLGVVSSRRVIGVGLRESIS
jgi:hypothetical protein